MSKFGLDFGLLVAYLVPGLIAAVVLGRHQQGVGHLLSTVVGADEKLAAVSLLTLLALVLGMSVSILRAIIVDPTFQIPMGAMAPPTARVDPNYDNLSQGERLAAYLEAKAAEKRPYQFYGNALLALLILTGSVLIKPADELHLGLTRRGVVLFAVLAIVVLYPASRRSHHRFMSSVSRFNSLLPTGDKPSLEKDQDAVCRNAESPASDSSGVTGRRVSQPPNPAGGAD